MALDVTTKERLSGMMKNLWLEGKIKPKSPWNKGISTKEIGKARPKRKWIIYNCLNCGERFEDWSVFKRKFCSGKCRGEFLRKNPELYAHLLKPEIGQKISEAKKGKPSLNQRNKKHWNWRGGITPEYRVVRNRIEWKLWREAVYARDNWTCQKCEVKGGKLHPHHIQNFAQFPELRTSIKNGTTLCKECHIKFHKLYGFKNNSKEQIEEFLSPIEKC